MGKPLFSPAELAEIARADAEIEASFSLTLDDIAAAKAVDALAKNERLCHAKAKIRVYKKAYREANKAEIAAHQKVYYEANKAEIAAYKKAYREANKAEIAAYQKAYYEANKAEIAAYQKAYYEANKARISAIRKSKREVLRHGQAVIHTGGACSNASRRCGTVQRKQGQKARVLPPQQRALYRIQPGVLCGAQGADRPSEAGI